MKEDRRQTECGEKMVERDMHFENLNFFPFIDSIV
jgi:hypothetical protein